MRPSVEKDPVHFEFREGTYPPRDYREYLVWSSIRTWVKFVGYECTLCAPLVVEDNKPSEVSRTTEIIVLIIFFGLACPLQLIFCIEIVIAGIKGGMRRGDMNNLKRSVIIIMLTVVPATTSHARHYSEPSEDIAWEEVSMAGEVFSAGTVISFLPNGARSIIIEQTQYFVSGGNWFLPVADKEGVKYQVVFAPM